MNKARPLMSKAIHWIRDLPLTVAGLVIMKALRLLLRLPEGMRLAILRISEGLARRIASSSEAAVALAEIKEIVEEDPVGREAIRRFLLENRDAQFLAMIRGMLKHHLTVGEAPAFVVEVSGVKEGRGRATRAATVGIVGDTRDLDSMRHAYEERRDCRVIQGVGHDKRLLDRADALEICDPGPSCEELISAALDREVAVSIPHGLVESPGTLKRLFAMSERAKTPLRVLYPYLYYPPVRKVKELIDAGEIGEVSTIRIRATIGGSGGSIGPDTPEREACLDHPAFDHFLLLIHLGGPIERVTAYLNPMDPEAGGQGLVDCKYEYPGRYGLLDCTFAPGMYIRSEHHPYDLEVEIAGSDGIVWLRRGMAKRTHAAPIYVRVGRRSYHIGVESGMPEEWNEVYRNAAEHMVNMLRGAGPRSIPGREIISAIELKKSTYKAARTREVVAL